MYIDAYIGEGWVVLKQPEKFLRIAFDDYRMIKNFSEGFPIPFRITYTCHRINHDVLRSRQKNILILVGLCGETY